MAKFWKKAAVAAGVLAFWLLVWQWAAVSIYKELIVASPVAVARSLISLVPTAEFWQTVAGSVLRIMLGYLLGVLLGAVLAVLTSLCGVLRALFSPLLAVVRATPVASFIILAWVWMTTGTIPVFIAMLMVIPIVWGNMVQGIAAVPQELREVCEVFRFDWKQKLRHLYLPAIRPYFAAAVTTSLGLAWKAGVAAEVLCRPDMSIGDAIYRAKITIETPDLFAWTLVVIALSMVLEWAVKRLLHGKRGKRIAA